MLTHWSRDKICDILQTFLNLILFERCCILIKISLKFVVKGIINNDPALVQILAWANGQQAIIWRDPTR